MTDAERQQRKRDRRKAGLVRLELWVPADDAEAVKQAVAEVLAARRIPLPDDQIAGP
jgi:hypothetical protein